LRGASADPDESLQTQPHMDDRGDKVNQHTDDIARLPALFKEGRVGGANSVSVCSDVMLTCIVAVFVCAESVLVRACVMLTCDESV
jgi:hypothetical protein